MRARRRRFPVLALAGLCLLAGTGPGLAASSSNKGEAVAAALDFPRQGRFVKIGHARISGAQGVGYLRLPEATADAGRPGFVDVWMPMLFTQGAPSDTPGVGYSAFLMRLDCGKRLATTRVSLAYTRQGEELSRDASEEAWQAIDPGTVMDDVRLVVCENQAPNFDPVEGFDALWADAEREATALE